MSHCYSVGVNVNGKEMDVCTIVPGNEAFGKLVKDAEAKGTKPKREPSKEEIDRAIAHHLKNHQHKEELDEQQKEMNDLIKD